MLVTRVVLPFLLSIAAVHGHNEPRASALSPALSSAVEAMAKRNQNANHCRVHAARFAEQRRHLRRGGRPGSYPIPIANTDEGAPPPNLTAVAKATKNGAKPHFDRIQDKVAVLAPEGITGPYYVGYGGHVRQDIRENQTGIPLILDLGFVNIKTCEPFPNLMIDVWHANAMGQYSAFTATKPYYFVNGPPVTETRNGSRGLLGALTTTPSDNQTWLRGLWPTNDNGVAEFQTILPGKYAGRAVHIHLKAYSNYTLLPNGSIAGHQGQSGIIHTGQVYLPDELMLDTFKTPDYAANSHPFTPNLWDPVYPSAKELGSNPVVHWELLGKTLEEGVVAYSTLAVDPDVSNPKF